MRWTRDGVAAEGFVRFVVDATHRPTHDGTVWDTPHLAFYEVLEAVSLTWGGLLESTGRPDLSIQHFAVVNVGSDFQREMFVGPLAIDIAVARVGTTSVTLEAHLAQDGRPAGRVRAVLVRINDDRTASAPLTAEQREALERISPH